MTEIVRIGENGVHDDTFEIHRPVGHQVYLLLLVKTTARFWVNGSWQETPPGCAVIVKPGQLHRYGANGMEYRNDWMHFQCSPHLFGEHFPFAQPIALHRAEHYYNLFHIICNEYFSVSHHRNLILDSLIKVLIHKLSDESNTTAYTDLYYELKELRKQIYQLPAKQWTTAKMAEGLNISVGYLHSLYRHYFNTTCIADVMQSRIECAQELLLSTNRPVSEIGEMCGYHSTEHFIRQFKTITGMTPGKFKMEHAKSSYISESAIGRIRS